MKLTVDMTAVLPDIQKQVEAAVTRAATSMIQRKVRALFHDPKDQGQMSGWIAYGNSEATDPDLSFAFNTIDKAIADRVLGGTFERQISEYIDAHFGPALKQALDKAIEANARKMAWQMVERNREQLETLFARAVTDAAKQ